MDVGGKCTVHGRCYEGDLKRLNLVSFVFLSLRVLPYSDTFLLYLCHTVIREVSPARSLPVCVSSH